MKCCLKILAPISVMMMAALITPASAWSGSWVIDGSYSFERGKYGGDANIEVTILSAEMSYYIDSWGFSLEVPHISVDGSETYVPLSSDQGFGQGPANGNFNNSSSMGTTTTNITRSGLGDISLSMSRAFYPSRPIGLIHEVIVWIKLPTSSDDENLGSGEVDYSLELLNTIGRGKWSPLFNLGYQVNGDPAGIDLEDIWFYTLGTGYALNRRTRLSVTYDFRQAVTDDSPDAESMSLVMDWQLTGDIDLSGELESGLSDASADTAIMISLSRRY